MSALGSGSLARRPRLAVLAVFFLLAVAPATAWTEERGPMSMPPEAAEHFQRGAAFYEAGELDRALVEFERGQRVSPHPDFLYAMAQVHRRKGNCAQAIRLYVDFLASGPPRHEADVARANVERCSRAATRVEPVEATPAQPVTPPTVVVFSPPPWSVAPPRPAPTLVIDQRATRTADQRAREETYPAALSLRPPTLPRDIVEVGVGLEVAFAVIRLPIAIRFGLRDRLELQAGMDILLAANSYVKSVYDVDERSRLPLDNAKLSFGLESALYGHWVHFRVALEAPINSDALPTAPIDSDYEQGDEPRLDEGVLDAPGHLRIVLGLPLHLALGKHIALFGLDHLLTVHTSPASQPDLRLGLGVVATLGKRLSFMLRHDIEVLQLRSDAIDRLSSLALEVALGRSGDIGLTYSVRRRGQEMYFGEPGTRVSEPFTDHSMKLYVQKRF